MMPFDSGSDAFWKATVVHRPSRKGRGGVRAVAARSGTAFSLRGLRLSRRRQKQAEAALIGLAFLTAVCVAGVLAFHLLRVVVLSITAAVNAAAPAAASARPAAAAITVPLTVQAGDTLWNLSKRYGDPNDYILDRVDRLARVNRLSSDARLVPGQRLVVPVENPTEIARISRLVAAADSRAR